MLARLLLVGGLAFGAAGCGPSAATGYPEAPDVWFAEVVPEDAEGALVRVVESGEVLRLAAAPLRVRVERTHPTTDDLGLVAVGFVVHPESRDALRAWTGAHLGGDVAVVLGASAVARVVLAEPLDAGFIVTPPVSPTGELVRDQLLPRPLARPSRSAIAVHFTEPTPGAASATVHHVEHATSVEVDPVALRVEIAGVHDVVLATGQRGLRVDVDQASRGPLDDWIRARVGREVVVVLGATALARITPTGPLGPAFELPLPTDPATAELIAAQLRP